MQPPDERDAFLVAHCPDASLREEMAALLRSADSTDPLGSLDWSVPGGASREPALEPGALIGPYVVLEQLGAGGMGEVFLGSDTRLHRKVALKCLTLAGALPELKNRILREARAAARINHPNVATIYDVIEHDGRAFIVMEYVEGESLAAYLRHERPSAADVIRIGRQLTAAVNAAHGRGVIHRDLKPGNVQLMPDGVVKVLDFGVAQAISTLTTSSDTTTGHATAATVRRQAGTPPYMAPEQLVGAPADERSDVYSLGVVLYEMAAGIRPHAAVEPLDLVAAVVRQPKPLHEVVPTMPGLLSRVIARALEADPDARFQSAAEFGRALDAAGDALAAAGAAPEGSWRRALRRPAVAVTGAVLSVLLLAGGLVAIRQRTPAHIQGAPIPVVAVLPLGEGASADPVAAGLTQVISANVSGVPGIVMVPSASTAQYRVDRPAIPLIGRTLGATHIVTGNVEVTGTTRHVTLTLLQASTGSVLSSTRLNASTSNVFALEEEITTWVMRQVSSLAGRQSLRAPTPPTTSVPAFEEYSQGRRFLEWHDAPGSLERAIAAFERATSRDPRFALAFASLGEAYWLRYQVTRSADDAGRAKDATLEALRLDPEQPLVRYGLAVIYRGTGKKREAADELRRAIASQPSSDELHRLLGRVYSDLGEVDRAIAEFMLAINLRPGFSDNYRALGLAYYDAGRYQDAVIALTRMTELQPDSSPGFQMLGTVYHALGDLDRALENYRRANAIKPSPTAWSNIGTIDYGRKRYGEALAAYRESIRLAPKEPATYRNLGDALTRLGDPAGAAAAYATAIQVCEQRLAIEKNDERTLALEALCLAKTGKLAKARALIEAATTISRSSAVLYQRAVIETLDHRPSDALVSLRAAIDQGYSRVLAADDDDLAPLRGNLEFRDLVAQPATQEGKAR